ncbi:MAG: hypothetical protein ACQEW8_00540 [Actinomycetota bacterium]
MSDFARDLNEWVERQASLTAEEEVLAAYSAANPAPEGEEWFISGQSTEGGEIAYTFDSRPVASS